MQRIIKLWLPVILCMGAIFYTSSIPGEDIPSAFPFQDIVYHLVIYLILAYFFARALKKTYFNIGTFSLIIFTLLFGVLYGMSDEIHQSFVSFRSVSGLDVFIDGIGSFVGGLFCRILT